MNDVRAISVKEPWASALVDGHKPVENRSAGFPQRHRGLVIVHASLTWSNRGLVDPRIHDAYEDQPAMLDRARAGMGCAIGHANLVDAHRDTGCCRPWGESSYLEATGKRRNGLVHLVFENPVRYDHPIPVRGALGLWKPAPELLKACEL